MSPTHYEHLVVVEGMIGAAFLELTTHVAR